MTEQETRGKIFNIIREFNVKKRRYSTHTEPSDDDELADALIAAGIGDVSEYKHRAEVAERALYNCCFNSLFAPFGIQRPTVDELYDAHLKTAEKELAEEGKDD